MRQFKHTLTPREIELMKIHADFIENEVDEEFITMEYYRGHDDKVLGGISNCGYLFWTKTPNDGDYACLLGHGPSIDSAQFFPREEHYSKNNYGKERFNWNIYGAGLYPSLYFTDKLDSICCTNSTWEEIFSSRNENQKSELVQNMRDLIAWSEYKIECGE